MDPGPENVGKILLSSTAGRESGNSVSRTGLESYPELISKFIQKSLAPRTWESYSLAWKRWYQFCLVRNVSCFLFDLDVFFQFLCSLLDKGVGYSVLHLTVSGVSFFFKLAGCQPFSNQFVVKQFLKGVKRSFRRIDSRRPITFELLGSLVSVLEKCTFSKFEAILFKVAFVVTFFGALRVGELAAANKKSFSPLEVSDINLYNNSVGIFIKKSKTDQFAKGSWIRLAMLTESPLCPVKTVSDYFDIRPQRDGSFLIHEDGSVLTIYQFNAILKKCLVLLNLSKENYSSHSFRIGAATVAASLGLNEAVIKKIGRWESDRFKLYIRPNLVL
ncbi:uncharacterized protein LOC120997666 isoform X1 [Bufo bufo]|nr:uncharacterized protein LOC120997666 isoform X1 [Bufo bufo]